MTTRTTRPTTALYLLATAALLILPAADSAADGYDSRGLIYGKVHTESGTLYEGRLRWNRGGEEAFWGDHFNGSKDERPYVDAVPRKDRRRTDYITIFGSRIGLRFSLGSRWAVVRFGDIKKIDVGRGDHAVLHMKDGSELELDGGSNDLGATINVWDGTVKLRGCLADWPDE